MKVLVTGNLGFVGSHLTELLVSAGHEVVGCDLSLFPDAVCGDLMLPSLQLNKDFRLLDRNDLSGVYAVAHLAGISNDPMGELNPGLTQEVNGNGTVEFAQIAKESGTRIFVFASSCSIYGSSGTRPKLESDQTNPLTEYSSSKLFAEVGLRRIAKKDFHVYILRNSTAYGASPVFRTDLVVNDLAAGMCANGVAEIKSDGSPWRPLIHCRDMARVFKEFIEHDPNQVSSFPINIGFEEENFQVKDIGDVVQSTWPSGVIRFLPSGTIDYRDYKVDFNLFRSIFPSFKPEFSLNSGVGNLKKFLEKINYSSADHISKKFVRIQELRKHINVLQI